MRVYENLCAFLLLGTCKKASAYLTWLMAVGLCVATNELFATLQWGTNLILRKIYLEPAA